MHRRYLVLATSLAVALTAGCSANPYVPERKFTEVSNARLLTLTGSRIARMVNVDEAVPSTMSPVTILTPEDVDARFGGSLDAALRFYSYPSPGGINR